MKKILLALAAIALTTTMSAAAETRVQVGRLACDVQGGIGLILGSSKDMTCKFSRSGFPTERYRGTIDKLGIDIGFTGRSHIEWLVFSGRSTQVRKGSLAGTYVGGSAEATLGVGLGGNWLIGGSRKGFALQPFSVQGQVGLNYSVALSRLTLY